MAEAQQGMSNGRDGAPASAVGTLLRQARERNGLSLAAAAQQLRIRDSYLRAIEEGNFRALPGATYAVGFLRSYADHLGLDPQEIVRRFREEVEELGRRTQLVFPSVPAEGKIPGGAILMIAAVVALVGYGGWYFLSERDTSIAEIAPTVPAGTQEAPAEEQAAIVAEGSAVSPAAIEPAAATTDLDSAVAQAVAAAAPTATGAEAAVPSAVETSGGADTAVSPETPSSTAESASATTDAVAPPMPEGGTDETASPAGELASAEDADLVPETPSEVAAAETATGEAAMPSDGGAAAVPPEAERHVAEEAATSDVASATDVIPPAPEPPSATEDLPQGQQYGVTNADARVVLVATQEAWVQIKKSSGEEVWTKVLRPGDSFMVPNEPGLMLATGNAGGLRVMVDGRPTAALGPIGVVRRGILLDPQRLIDGTAAP
jgi:cytoskeletal protein RodZ